ncbi:hypothetical protein ACHAWX_003011, partial [Stephanocyclus meneghinianus]
VDSSAYLYAAAAAAASSGRRVQNANADSRGAPDEPINLLTAHDKALYNEVLKRITSGHAIHNIPIRFVTSSGNVVHLLLDCDGNAILQPNAASVEDRYYRCFTRDDTARRIQEMRSNVLFQETNRSLQILDNFMNRSMTQMRLPLALMERACNLVAENIEDIYEVICGNATSMLIPDTNIRPPISPPAPTVTAAANIAPASSISLPPSRIHSEGEDRKRRANAMRPLTSNNRPNNSQVRFENVNMDFSALLNGALSATSEARSVVGLASRIVDDALALVDDITDLCRFDQGQGIVVDKEAVKLRDICIEALARVPIPLGSGVVEVLLDIQPGTPSRAMTDRSVLQRCLALLMNFAVDAAANAASKASSHSQVSGKVILSISDAALYQAQGSTSSCKISIFYTNPPDKQSVVARTSDGADIYNNDMFSVGQHHGSIRGDNLFQSSSYGERGGSMTRRTRLRESIERGMTTYQREKLGLGLSLVHHLVSAQGSDLRYEIVADETMTKFWFLLPMSLDFPERLNAEMIMKDDMQVQGSQLSACRPLKRPKVPESMAVPPHPSNSLNSTLAPEAMHSPELPAPSTCAPAITVQNAVSNSDEIAETRERPKKYPGVAPGARPLVLVVEDTDVSASLLCMHLRKLNCTSHRAENGEVALEMLRSAPDPSMYSLVLMDLRMPVMDGFEAAEIIKGSIASNIPIVALTGETSEEHKKKCDEIGFDDYQTKPLKRPQLKELLNKFVPGYQCPP